MEDEDIVPNLYLQLIQSAREESHASTTLFQDRNTYTVVVLARLSSHYIPTGSAVQYVFGAISSFSILRPILYATYHSMV